MVPREFGFSEYCTPMWSFEEDLRHFRKAGATCLELLEAKLKADKLDEQLALLRESGLRVSTVQPAVESFFNVKLSRTMGNLDANRQSLYRSVELVGKYRLGDRINTLSGVLPSRTWEEALPTVAGEYRELCKRAADRGVKIMIEPLNPVYCGLDSLFSCLKRAARLIDTF